MVLKVLLTGASGLLGRAIYKSLEKDSTCMPIGLAFTRAAGDLKKVDITEERAVQAVITETRPDVVIHSAAERRPDVVDGQEAATFDLNITATKNVCKFAGQLNAPVVFISTDYVFDGRNPPYQEHDEAKPLNKYGQSKLAGERIVLDASARNIVLRVPLLYGQVETLAESAVTTLFDKVKNSEVECSVSHYERRFPTHTDDVADVIVQLLHLHQQDAKNINGIYHWSGVEMMTKYDMVVAMATAFDLGHSHVRADDKAPSGGTTATRPYNSQLATTRLGELGISGPHTPFAVGIKHCLQAFL